MRAPDEKCLHPKYSATMTPVNWNFPQSKQTATAVSLMQYLLCVLRHPHVHFLALGRLGLVELLGLRVERCALLDFGEALDLERRTGSIDRCNPWIFLAPRTVLLADDLAMLVLHEVGGGEPSLGLFDLTCEG